MPSSLTNDFIATFQEAEKTHHETTLAALFSPDAELKVMTSLVPGQPQARSAAEFWKRYLHAFVDVASTFHHTTEAENIAVLEWTTDATLPTGGLVRYCGVSILEHDGESIIRFRTYFDTAALLPEIPRSHKRYSQTAGPPQIEVGISS